jgi:crotonobetainyl-CoA:carnitine CoA-transferase CaiB-like acyl-CoA transferase
MTEVMAGIRIVDVADLTFVPAAAAILAEWGADVIKVEHAGPFSTSLWPGPTSSSPTSCRRFERS